MVLTNVVFRSVLASPLRNGIYKAPSYHGSGAKIINMGELFANPKLGAVPMNRVELTPSETDQFGVQPGDLLFARRSLVLEGAGKCSVVMEVDGPTTFESSIIRARIDPSKANSIYLFYFWASRVGQYCLSLIRRQVAVAGITGRDLSHLEIPLPPLPEQRAIVAALSDVDALINSLDRLIAKKRDIKQATMQQLLTGKTRLPGFSGKWEVKALEDIAEVIMGQSPEGSSYNRKAVGSPLINGPTEFTDMYPIKIQWTTRPTKFCRNFDLLLCVRGSSTGRINISDDEYCIGRGIAAIRAKLNANTAFITFQVRLAVQEILSLTTGSTFPNLDGKSIRRIPIPFPCLSEQTAIATVLTDMDTEFAILEQRRDKTLLLKQGMMQELLTGRTRLV